ncbi:merozoite surface protein, putative [Trichomonas vaginalis G3]|uniref:Merozoite surface protein, putative n=1 Tax=Trichomonas vaginalis (strain ATCC PRA-98 / G3) TaxID=412133 RepID=A2E4U0_TRIV3|nr:hypothetical protein TVAGG3_0227840 [Trichomonas vaginalis G3]EAY12279.1 merozoite surface protein, putative [Trichomonas vaginalis G3]KAI5552395.1 hypothetical protein TVAGG3_0227840 [Trichomonas vaginalis G3]|eukprot:XP_001324502.1 merozoite surface protein [Trichomonas vaginalis G3]
MFLFAKPEFGEFFDLKRANKACQEADQAYSKQMSKALSHPLELWSRTLDSSLLPKMAEIYKCSQQITATIAENVKSTESVYGNLQDLTGLRAEFQPTKVANQKILKHAKEAAAKVAKTEKALNDLQKSNASAAQIARAEAEHQSAVEAERSASSIAQSSQNEFIQKYKDYQQRFVSILAASYCEASTLRAKTASSLAEIGVKLEGIANRMKTEPDDAAFDAQILSEMQKLEPLFNADAAQEDAAAPEQ